MAMPPVRPYRDVLSLRQLEHHEERGGHVTILAAGRATVELNDPTYAGFIDEVGVGQRIDDRPAEISGGEVAPYGPTVGQDGRAPFE